MIDHYELEASNHRKLAAEKRVEARDSQSQDLRMILEETAKDADGRAEYWLGRARPYLEQAEAYSKLSRMFEQAASRPWKPLPPIPEEWPLTFQ